MGYKTPQGSEYQKPKMRIHLKSELFFDQFLYGLSAWKRNWKSILMFSDIFGPVFRLWLEYQTFKNWTTFGHCEWRANPIFNSDPHFNLIRFVQNLKSKLESKKN